MKLFVQIMSQNASKNITIEAKSSQLIEEIKEKINQLEGIPVDQQRFQYLGKHLENGNSLEEYFISNNARVFILTDFKIKSEYKPIQEIDRSYRRSFGGGMTIRKPVLYLYPENDNFEVKVKVLAKKGEISSRYPIIKSEDSETWAVKVNKKGEIQYHNRTHYYLFWEVKSNFKFKQEEGFVIKGEDSFSFFEEKLAFFGFNEREANDFITFWCPLMEHSKYVSINFQGKDYDSNFPLIIDPKPDTIRRIFMTFKLIDEKIEIPEQNLSQFQIRDRKGFMALEWGGCDISDF